MLRVILLLLCVASPGLADVLGTLRVIDGDTFDIGSERVRLHGVDAPEFDQMCTDANGADWACGAFVSEQVRAFYDGATATCRQVDVDQYGRIVGKCFVDGNDIGERLVRDGLVQAFRRFSMDYDRVERTAQAAGIGLWAGTMQAPSDFRASRPPTAPAVATNGTCNIKGNISGSGQIYHMPHNRDYDKTRISEAKGERWFCTEQEARAAGWRAAGN